MFLSTSGPPVVSGDQPLMGYCAACFEKQRKIDQLQEENHRLKALLHQRQRKEKEGCFGSSTPSSQVPVKANTPEKTKKKRGAKPGHPGAGRKAFDEAEADEVVELDSPRVCPDCGGPLQDKGATERRVVESRPLKAQQILYRVPKGYCCRCRRSVQPRPPGVLPKSLYGNQLVANAAVMHYLHGIPLGRVCSQIGLEPGPLVEIFHRLAHLFEKVPPALVETYRQSPVKHADETGWRTDGKNGYAWLFATERISLFQFQKTRSARVANAVLGEKELPGVLVVDRYAGYNQAPCPLQYCYAHLLRDVQDLEKEFPQSGEVKAFVSTLAPLLSLAMNLRTQPLSDQSFRRKATRLKAQILEVVHSDAQHLGIRRIQDLFRKNEHRLYHWAEDRRIPAENNLAERDLRPTVIARKVSFGSQSDAGAHTRSILMSVLQTLRKQDFDVTAHLKQVLDQVAANMHQDPLPLLFPRASPHH